jgi:hypothetical protein
MDPAAAVAVFVSKVKKIGWRLEVKKNIRFQGVEGPRFRGFPGRRLKGKRYKMFQGVEREDIKVKKYWILGFYK